MDKNQALAFISSVNRVLSEAKDLSNISLSLTAKRYYDSRNKLAEIFPEIYELMPGVKFPHEIRHEYGANVEIEAVESILLETKAFLEFWSTYNSSNTSITPPPRRVFITHGRSEDWRRVQEYIEKTLELPTLELAQESNKGRTIFQKLVDEADRCSFAVIIMTGDDSTTDEQVRARENVIHEIGYFQGKYGSSRVCLLHENEVNIPTNIQGLVYIPFPQGGIEASFGGLTRELKHL